jgi:hypothetical protein
VDNILGSVAPTQENSRKQLYPACYKSSSRTFPEQLSRQYYSLDFRSPCTTGMRYLSLTPHSGNTFAPKNVYLPAGNRIVLGRATESNPAHPSNALFPREMSISLNHAEIWYEDDKVGLLGFLFIYCQLEYSPLLDFYTRPWFGTRYLSELFTHQATNPSVQR